jgi:hypothetical protein
VNLGIVGSEEKKFTEETKGKAKDAIHAAISRYNATCVVSGGCHLGGVDIYAEEVAAESNLATIIHKPQTYQWNGWEGCDGFKQRNLKIARDSDVVICITLLELPSSYYGMRFEGCYHCGKKNPPHIKSGGCWTAWRGKEREWIII